MPGTHVRIKWHDERVLKQINAEMSRRLDLAGEMVRSQVVRNISIPTRSAGPSKPGEFPHADTGKLRQSIFSARTSPTSVIIGSPLVYSRPLEISRSYLLRTLLEMQPKLRKLFQRPMRGG